MAKKTVNIYEESMAQQGCGHYWIIETAAGPISRGICQFCGAQREFGNYLRDCLKVDREDYLEWIEGRRYNKKEEKSAEDILSQGAPLQNPAASLERELVS